MAFHATVSLLKRHWFSAQALEIWSDARTLQGWLDVEAAIAQAQAELGIIPATAAREIRARAHVELFDMEALAADIARVEHPFVPVVRHFAKLCDGNAGEYIHWGATTANVTNTGGILQLRDSHRLILAALEQTAQALSDLSRRHRDTLMAGRTHGQHALPITFGFKAAAWLAEIERHRTRLLACESRVFVASLGGGVGTMAALGEQGLAMQARMAEILELGTPDVPVRTAYDGVAEYVALVGLMGATMERIAQEVVFLQRTEIGEAAEPFAEGKVGSSTMAQKRNPSRCLTIIANSRMLRSRMALAAEAMIRSNEGDASAANVSDGLLPEVGILAVSIVQAIRDVLSGLTIDAAAMRRNLDLSMGMILAEAVMMRLAPHIGRNTAHEVVYEAAMHSFERRTDFRHEVMCHPALAGLGDAFDADEVFDPARYTGLAGTFVDQVSARRRRTDFCEAS